MRPSLVLGTAWRRTLSATAPALVAGAVVGFVVVLPVIGEVLSFAGSTGLSPASAGTIATTNVGNLPHTLSPYEGLGLWFSNDFRLAQGSGFHAGEWAAFALAVALFGWFSLVAARRLWLPSAVAACAVIWLVSSHTQSQYVTAKALVVGAPMVTVVALRSLLALRRERLVSWASGARLAVTVLFVGGACYSSYLVLTNEPVEAFEQVNELEAFHARTGDASVLFLGADDFDVFDLRDSPVSALTPLGRGLGQASPRANKPYVYGYALDFDSVDAATLDRFKFVITSNSPAASQAPSNFRLIAQRTLYELWARTGPTIPREVVEPPGAPGAGLDCRVPAGWALHLRTGIASITSPPIATATPVLAPGESAPVSLALPSGLWYLSLEYASDVDIEVRAEGTQWTLPAYLGRPGPLFRVGVINGDGTGSPVVITLTAQRPSALAGDRLAAHTVKLVAISYPVVHRIMTLHASCGRYVDWYRLKSP